MRILAVDDDDVSLEMLGGILQHYGHELLVAQDGREAIDLLIDNPCRLVITDWEMPRMSGLELCRAIRRRI